MYGYVYITTCRENNKSYIGRHKGTFDSSYLGSGVVFSRAIEKYGKEYIFYGGFDKFCEE